MRSTKMAPKNPHWVIFKSSSQDDDMVPYLWQSSGRVCTIHMVEVQGKMVAQSMEASVNAKSFATLNMVTQLSKVPFPQR